MCLSFAVSEAQHVNKSLGLDFYRGFIFEHKPQISHLITEHPIGFRITYNRKSYGSERWMQRYNFPDRGLTFIYMNFGDPRLDKAIGLLPHFNFHLRKDKQAKGQPQFKMGFGAGYLTAKYDRVDNNQNNVISTDLSGAVLLQLAYEYRLSQRWFINLNTSLTHFSNGALKLPNSGINTVSGHLGVNYIFNYEKTEYQTSTEEKFATKPIGITAILIGGMHETIKINSGARPFFVLSGIVDKQLNHKSRLGLGLEWFYSESLKEEREFIEPSNLDFNRIGLVLSHELMINEFSVISHFGYYLYNPMEVFQPFYLRLKLRRYFGDRLFSSIGVKSHWAKAEAMEFAIGYRIK